MGPGQRAARTPPHAMPESPPCIAIASSHSGSSGLSHPRLACICASDWTLGTWPGYTSSVATSEGDSPGRPASTRMSSRPGTLAAASATPEFPRHTHETLRALFPVPT